MTERQQRWRGVWICLGLAVAVLAVYWPVHQFEFINFDDPDYVVANPQVRGGLTVGSLVWALTTRQAGNWHPLTWVSHLVDVTLFGLKPGGHHLTSLLFHGANTLLLFGLLRRMTGKVWRSGMVAALFGLHPLHVESVAWVAERKDVLSAFFFLLTLWAYTRYVEESRVGSRKSKIWYGQALIGLALGLMSKPMVVTLPFVLLLLDYWPLGRLDRLRVEGAWANFRRLIWEKVPFLVLAGVSCLVTYGAQKSGGAVTGWEVLPLGERAGNALVSYVRYVGKGAWPSGLAVFYPYRSWPVCGVLLAGLGWVGMTVLGIRRLGREPWLGVGWLWYVGMLVPVIGLVQVGQQAMADRYTYLPLIGLFILGVWGTATVLAGRPWGRWVSGLLSGGVLIGCLGGTGLQLQHWRSSITLFEHALGATSNNVLAHNNLGVALFQQGKVAEAIAHYEQALRIDPKYAEAHYNLGNALVRIGQASQAVDHYEQAIRRWPQYVKAHNNLGAALLQLGRIPEAIEHYEQALRFKPDYAGARRNLGVARFEWGGQLAAQGQWEDALQQYERAVQLKPEDVGAHERLGLALSQCGRYAEAVASFERALAIDAQWVDARNHLAWLLATCPDGSLRDGARAVALAEEANKLGGGKDAAILDTLAAAYAEAGRFNDAVRTAQSALELVKEDRQGRQARRIQGRLQLYQSGQPYREATTPAP